VARPVLMRPIAMRKIAASVVAVVALFSALPAHAGDVWFNSDPDVNLTGEVLAAFDRNVEAAAGRPTDIYVNIFAFTERTIAEKMLLTARDNPNVTIKMVTDWSMLSASGSHMAPYLEMAAAGKYTDACNGLESTPAKRASCKTNLETILGGTKLPNLQIRYKKDDPYRYDATLAKVVYDHGQTDGLNHHKGVAFVVDGVPVEMLTGSFNWSPTANNSNYENLMRFSREKQAERALIRAFAAETGAMFNNAAVSLNGDDARALKTWLYDKHEFAAGVGPDPGPAPSPTTGGSVAVFSICPNPTDAPSLEELENMVNGAIAVLGADFAEEPLNVNNAPFKKLVSKLGVTATVARAIVKESRVDGAFTSIEDLKSRVAGTSGIAAAKFEGTEFGTNTVAVNHASEEDLQALDGVGAVSARKIVSWIEANGPMESIDDLKKAGLSPSTVARIAPKVDLTYSEAFFSAKLLDCPTAGTGFAAMNATSTTLVADADGTGATRQPSSLPAPAIDLFRRAKTTDTIKIATYGFSASSPEYQAMKAAVERGATVKVVLNSAYNESVATALQKLGADNGGRVEVKWFKSRTMHEKFGVVGNDVFNGSANLNPSSTGKHAEDRYILKNDTAFADAFHAEFDRLWERASVPPPPVG